jgi:hypothetical protein
MSQTTVLFFCGAFFVISILYACVGQAGASGYIAAMALFGFAPAAIKPTALVLNVLVSAVVSLRFYRAGFFSWRLFLPFAVASVPPALLGGYITLPPACVRLSFRRSASCCGGAFLCSPRLSFVFHFHAEPPGRISCGQQCWLACGANGHRWRCPHHPPSALLPLGAGEAGSCGFRCLHIRQLSGSAHRASWCYP